MHRSRNVTIAMEDFSSKWHIPHAFHNQQISLETAHERANNLKSTSRWSQLAVLWMLIAVLSTGLSAIHIPSLFILLSSNCLTWCYCKIIYIIFILFHHKQDINQDMNEPVTCKQKLNCYGHASLFILLSSNRLTWCYCKIIYIIFILFHHHHHHGCPSRAMKTSVTP